MAQTLSLRPSTSHIPLNRPTRHRYTHLLGPLRDLEGRRHLIPTASGSGGISEAIPTPITSFTSFSTSRFLSSLHRKLPSTSSSSSFFLRSKHFPDPRIGSDSKRHQSTRSESKRLVVLGIESSADDSCASVVSSDREILSNVVIKQHLINAKYGGIQPIEAMRAHMANIVCLSRYLPLPSLQSLSDWVIEVGDEKL